MLSVLGSVTVKSLAVVKVVSKVALAAAAVTCLAVGLNTMLPGGLSDAINAMTGGETRLGLSSSGDMNQALVAFLGFAGAAGLWHVTDRVQAKVEVGDTKRMQERELQRLESQHGQPLSRA